MKILGRRVIHKGFFRFEIIETDRGPREVLFTTDSVSILLYNPTERYVVLVRQPRESMVTDDNPEGLLTETVAGRFDVDLGVRALAVKEADEEVGATITEDQVELLNNGQPMTLSAGAVSEKAYLAIAEIDTSRLDAEERIRTAEGEDEQIQRLIIGLDELSDSVYEDLRVFTLIHYLFAKLALAKLDKEV